MTKTIKTKVHAFNFNLDVASDKIAYEALRNVLKSQNHPHKMRSLTTGRSYYQTGRDLDGKTIELECTHLFDNQWNTAPIEGVSDTGLRVFDWAEDALFTPSGREKKHIRCGYWLEQTEEMRAVRSQTVACGYCGKQRNGLGAPTFCDQCIGSEYLTRDTLHLLRLLPVAQSGVRSERAELTTEEADWLVPCFIEAQTKGNTARDKARIAKRRANIIASAKKTIDAARAEERGLLWLMDHGYNGDNVIYYSHTGRFCFGWRAPLDADVKSRLLDILSEFPFEYDIQDKPKY